MAILHRKFETISIRDRANQNIKPNHDVFLTLTSDFFFVLFCETNLTRAQAQKMTHEKQVKNKEHMVFLTCDK